MSSHHPHERGGCQCVDVKVGLVDHSFVTVWLLLLLLLLLRFVFLLRLQLVVIVLPKVPKGQTSNQLLLR